MFFKNKKIIAISFLFVIYLLYPKPAKAVIPPDFIFNIGTSIAQVFSVVILFFSALFATTYQFIKLKFASLKHRRIFLILSIVLVIFGSLGISLIYTLRKENIDFKTWLNLYQISKHTTDDTKDYFYDRIIVSAKDDQQQPLVAVFEGSRQETKQPGFSHSYGVYVLYQGKVFRDFTSFTSPSSTVQAHDFITSFSSNASAELPEFTYTMGIKLDTQNFTFTFSDLESDFLVKNNLEYIRFISPGLAKISVGGKVFSGHVMVDRVLSTNGKIPTLEGYEVKRTSHSIALWQENGDFYHIDTSQVFTPNVPYASHTWVLYKNAQTKSTNKLYEASVVYTPNPEPSWKIIIPELNNTKLTFKLISTLTKNSEQLEGYVQGTVQDKSGKHEVSGYALYEDIK